MSHGSVFPPCGRERQNPKKTLIFTTKPYISPQIKQQLNQNKREQHHPQPCLLIRVRVIDRDTTRGTQPYPRPGSFSRQFPRSPVPFAVPYGSALPRDGVPKARLSLLHSLAQGAAGRGSGTKVIPPAEESGAATGAAQGRRPQQRGAASLRASPGYRRRRRRTGAPAPRHARAP